ncbi:acyl carrier protein [Streptomyces sp. NPDC101165]|uniref:acyl carrier protein n=1 Tax=Streptomyces sp. NPDC101165 TaxID=3366119 RepID=UPI003818A306
MVSTHEEISSEFSRIVHEIAGVPLDDIQPGKNLVHDLELDSLSMVEIMVAAEETFGVKIPDEELHRLPTVELVTAYIEREQA